MEASPIARKITFVFSSVFGENTIVFYEQEVCLCSSLSQDLLPGMVGTLGHKTTMKKNTHFGCHSFLAEVILS